MSIRRVRSVSMQLLCLVSLSGSALLAGTITGGTASFSETLPFSNSSTVLTGFSQYNGSQPLKAIQFNFVTNVTGSATITDGPGPNGPNPAQPVTMNFAAALSVYDPSNTAVLVSSAPVASTQVIVPGDGTPVTANVSATGVTTTAQITDSALFAPFVGSGTFSLPVRGEAQVGFTPNLIIPFNIADSGTASGTVEITYELGAVTPEPSTASILLLAGGLAAFVGGRRHRASHS